MHKIDKHTGLYLVYDVEPKIGDTYDFYNPLDDDASPTYKQSIEKAKMANFVKAKAEQYASAKPQEEYQPYVCHVLRSSEFRVVVDRDFWKKGQVVYLEDNEPMTIKSNPKSDGLGYAYETDIYNQFVPWTRIYAFRR